MPRKYYYIIVISVINWPDIFVLYCYDPVLNFFCIIFIRLARLAIFYFMYQSTICNNIGFSFVIECMYCVFPLSILGVNGLTSRHHVPVITLRHKYRTTK